MPFHRYHALIDIMIETATGHRIALDFWCSFWCSSGVVLPRRTQKPEEPVERDQNIQHFYYPTPFNFEENPNGKFAICRKIGKPSNMKAA